MLSIILLLPTDFGDLTVARTGHRTGSNTTRATFIGGEDPAISNVIDFVTIATTGNATDFGDLKVGNRTGQTMSSISGGVQ
jgi:hypothetical protein